MKLAHSLSVDHQSGRVVIDGVDLPFYLAVEGPEIENIDGVLSRVSLPILVDGVVTIRTRGGETEVHDPHLGEIGEWARNLVRTGLLAKFPWINLPEGATP